MKFEWDIEKEKTNRKKHGVAFQEACYVFADKFMLTLYDERHSDDEDRWITIGQSLNNRLTVVIHTYGKTNNEVIRIISARKAAKHEEKQYLERRG